MVLDSDGPREVCLLVGEHRILVQSSALVAESKFFKTMLGDLLATQRGPGMGKPLEIPLRESVGKEAAEKLVSYAEGERTIKTVRTPWAIFLAQKPSRHFLPSAHKTQTTMQHGRSPKPKAAAKAFRVLAGTPADRAAGVL